VTSIVICGIRGRMGQAVLRLARERADLRVAGGIDPAGGDVDGVAVMPLEAADEVLAGVDVVIDFSTAAATAGLLLRPALAGRAVVIGTTGLSADTERVLSDAARHAAVLTAANFSIGVNLLLGLTERVAAALEADNWDIEVVEAHHRRKTDAPSGTALALARAAAAGRGVDLDAVRRDGRSGDTGARPDGQIGLHAVRGGGVVGEHTVMFIGERERIELRHDALDRALFAEGALRAARWMAGRAPGRYSMQDVLGLGATAHPS
jgi:4-hydroxy-tetrahydrodipicolinate reductase